MIDQKNCIGCGSCENVCPEFFQIDQSGSEFKAKIKTENGLAETASLELSDEKLKKVKEAVEICATQAIKLEE